MWIDQDGLGYFGEISVLKIPETETAEALRLSAYMPLWIAVGVCAVQLCSISGWQSSHHAECCWSHYQRKREIWRVWHQQLHGQHNFCSQLTRCYSTSRKPGHDTLSWTQRQGMGNSFYDYHSLFEMISHKTHTTLSMHGV